MQTNDRETSQEILPESERLKTIDLIADSVELDYCIRYHKALESSELRVKELLIQNLNLNDNNLALDEENEIMQDKIKELGEENSKLKGFINHVELSYEYNLYDGE